MVRVSSRSSRDPGAVTVDSVTGSWTAASSCARGVVHGPITERQTGDGSDQIAPAHRQVGLA